MMEPERCAHHRHHVLAGHDRAAQIDGGDAVERRLGDLVERRVAAGDTHTHVVVKHVDAAPTLPCGLHHRRERLLLGNVRLECHAFSPRLSRHRDCFLGGSKVAVDGQHLCPLLDEAHHRGAPVAHAFARRLAGADHDGDLVPETHMNLGCLGFIASLMEMASQARTLWTLH